GVKVGGGGCSGTAMSACGAAVGAPGTYAQAGIPAGSGVVVVVVVGVDEVVEVVVVVVAGAEWVAGGVVVVLVVGLVRGGASRAVTSSDVEQATSDAHSTNANPERPVTA